MRMLIRVLSKNISTKPQYPHMKTSRNMHNRNISNITIVPDSYKYGLT